FLRFRRIHRFDLNKGMERSTRMSEEKNRVCHVHEAEGPSAENTSEGIDRRKFLLQAGAAATIAASVLATPSVASAQSIDSRSSKRVPPPAGIRNQRILQSF